MYMPPWLYVQLMAQSTRKW